MSGRVDMCRVAKKQLELRDSIASHVDSTPERRAESVWESKRLQLKIAYQRGETMEAKDYIAGLYGIMAYLDEHNRKI